VKGDKRKEERERERFIIYSMGEGDYRLTNAIHLHDDAV
jgi:hypothetical protein